MNLIQSPCRKRAPGHSGWNCRSRRWMNLTQSPSRPGAPGRLVANHWCLMPSRAWDCRRSERFRQGRNYQKAVQPWSIPIRSRNPFRVRQASPAIRATQRLFVWTDASSCVVPIAWLPPLVERLEGGPNPPHLGASYGKLKYSSSSRFESVWSPWFPSLALDPAPGKPKVLAPLKQETFGGVETA